MAAFIERFIPDIVVKLLIGVDPVGMSGQKRQNIEFNAGKFAVSAIEGNGEFSVDARNLAVWVKKG